MRVPVVSHPFAKPRLSSAKAELALVRMQCSKASQVRFRPKADMGLAPAQQGAPVQFGPHVTERAAQAPQLHMPCVASNVRDDFPQLRQSTFSRQPKRTRPRGQAYRRCIHCHRPAVYFLDSISANARR
jgi:hypothetical protein